MAKTIKAKSDLGVNSIMDAIMVPDGFSRVCDGLDLRSGVSKVWQLPSYHRPLTSTTSTCIWEYRGKWYESDLMRTYHGEYLYGQEAVYFTEEGIGHLPPQKIVDGKQARLGTRRPLAQPLVSSSDSRYPTSATAVVSGSGGVPIGSASYRISAIKDNAILPASGPIKVQIVSASAVKLSWREVPGADGYAVFGRTSGSERLLIKLANTLTWTDDGSTPEGYESASSFDVTRSYQYVYTYYRKVGNIEDESGPSPLSVASDATKIPTISRLPGVDGFFLEDTTTYNTATNTLTATKPAGVDKALTQALPRTDGSLTIFTTATAHGMANGDIGYLVGTVSPLPSSTDPFQVVVPAQVAQPVASIAGYAVGGTVSVGAHTYRVVAVRGDSSATYGNPAQTTGAVLNATVPGGSGSVILSFDTYGNGTDSFIVYRDGNPVAVVPITVATWTDTGFSTIAGISYSGVNETATRCFVINDIGASLTGSTGVFGLARTEIVLAGVTGFAPTPRNTITGVQGDVLYISGTTKVPEIIGVSTVIGYDPGTGKITIDRRLTVPSGTTDSTGGLIKWRPGNSYYRGWRLYRVGDTAEFLRVADLGLEVTSFVDTVSVDNLGVAIPTAYQSRGVEVVYDRAPEGLKRMVPHFGMRFGIVDNVVRWTPNNVPDAWPDVYYAAFPSRPVNIASYKGILAVVCEDGLYGLVGNTASSMSPAGPYSNLGCIAPFSLQASNAGLMWLTKTGIAISHDGTSAYCMTSDKVPGRYFYAPSTAGILNNIPIGYGWHLPATQTVQFAESMAMEQIDDSMFPVSQVTADLPASGEILDIKSFFWDNRYALYYSSAAQHARSGCVTVDMATQQLALTTLPVKPTHVHVSLGGDCYMLLQPRPVTVVTITSPP